jgi:hypothetical protein
VGEEEIQRLVSATLKKSKNAKELVDASYMIYEASSIYEATEQSWKP